jgi:prevent-host-death family protein
MVLNKVLYSDLQGLSWEVPVPLKEKVKPITYLKNRTADLVREVSESGNSVVITQNGEAKVVVMDMNSYDRWRDAMALLKILSQSQADIEESRIVSNEEAFSRASAAIDKNEKP